MSYIRVEVWKARAAELGIEWKDVRANYELIRSSSRDFETTIKAVRQRAFETGVRKNHPAFWRGDTDLDSIDRFDEVADGMTFANPWLAKSDDPSGTLFEILHQNESEFLTRDNDAWQQAIQKTLDEKHAAEVEFHPSMFEDTEAF